MLQNLQEVFNQLFNWFLGLNDFVRTLIIIVLGYIFVLGLLEFVKKVLIKIPVKIIEFICIGIIIYMLVINFFI